MAPARSTIEYHTKTRTDASVNVKLTNSGLTLDIYSLRPSTIIATSVDTWSGTFSAVTEYVVVVKNCSGKTSSKFQLEITSN
jgi:nucleoside recognition membrane protein YjiH